MSVHVRSASKIVPTSQPEIDTWPVEVFSLELDKILETATESLFLVKSLSFDQLFLRLRRRKTTWLNYETSLRL